ncbi:hypothetical protein [Streptomyces albidoflavus]|uniref:hypothetical protein n=1 Tax=Streptomyces albidoflavus TaxID=1886 RepID=UPI00332C3AF7
MPAPTKALAYATRLRLTDPEREIVQAAAASLACSQNDAIRHLITIGHATLTVSAQVNAGPDRTGDEGGTTITEGGTTFSEGGTTPDEGGTNLTRLMADVHSHVANCPYCDPGRPHPRCADGVLLGQTVQAAQRARAMMDIHHHVTTCAECTPDTVACPAGMALASVAQKVG